MPSWTDVLIEINGTQQPTSLDIVRRKYLLMLSEKTRRNTIAYYSGWLKDSTIAGTEINDMDINAFMSAIHDLDFSKGLDLILHTPGGGISATEHIVYYLKEIFGNNIRAIIPQIAMSAGTMMACSCSSILMGKQSSLGPFDPHVNGLSATRVIREFERAVKEAQINPACIPFWQAIISKYHPTFLEQCDHAVERSSKIVTSWLTQNMLANLPHSEKIADQIVDYFTKTGADEEHSRHISLKDALGVGLKIESLESDQELQDLVLTVHHAYMHTFSQCPTLIKIIENHAGNGMFNFAN